MVVLRHRETGKTEKPGKARKSDQAQTIRQASTAMHPARKPKTSHFSKRNRTMTIDAQYAAPLADPMHTLLDNALTPYLDGDQDANDELIDALLNLIASAERTPDLIRTLHTAIKTLPASVNLMPAMHKAIGAALELEEPAPANTGYSSTPTSRSAAARTSSGVSREGSIAGRIKSIFNNHPGQTYRVGDLVKALSAMGYDHSGGAVGAALNGMVSRGEAVQIGEKPRLYLAADDPEAPQQITDPAPATAEQAPTSTDAPETQDQAPAAEATPAPETDAPKTTGTRRAPAKK
jgi:hypothetical protein